MPSTGEDAEKQELSCFASGKAEQNRPSGPAWHFLMKSNNVNHMNQGFLPWVFTQEKWKLMLIQKPVHKCS